MDRKARHAQTAPPARPRSAGRQSRPTARAAGASVAGASAPDLRLLANAAPKYVQLGGPQDMLPSIINSGGPASSVMLTATVAGPFLFQAAGGPGWACQGPSAGSASPVVTCQTPSVTASAPALTVTLSAPLVPATADYTVTVSSSVADADPHNNTATGRLLAFAHSANGNPWDLADAATNAYSARWYTFPDSGALTDGGQDAFDGFGQLRVSVAGAPAPLTDTVSHLGLVYAGAGLWNTTPPQSVSGIQVSRRISAPPSANWVRYVDTFVNTNPVTASVQVMWGGNLGSDFGATVRDSSTGD